MFLREGPKQRREVGKRFEGRLEGLTETTTWRSPPPDPIFTDGTGRWLRGMAHGSRMAIHGSAQLPFRVQHLRVRVDRWRQRHAAGPNFYGV
jgi:hypothetical protein